MKVYDIAQEVLSCRVYPGDPIPKAEQLVAIGKNGAIYNMTSLSMCNHNGTHVDAPAHFIENGTTIDQMPVDTFVGPCIVVRHEGDVTADDAQRMLRLAGDAERLLIAGPAVVTAEAAEVFAASSLRLIGNESQSVGPVNAPAAVHRLLLGRGMALLEGVVLDGIPEGRYILSAAPLNLAGCEGAACRAVLIDL